MTRAQKTPVTILGSTGSVGRNTLKVINNNTDRYSVYGLSAWRDVDTMLAQCVAHAPTHVVMVDEAAAEDLRLKLQALQLAVRVSSGDAALCELASDCASQTVMAAIVGAAGLPSLIAAVDAGKRVLIANKEPLVMMGAQIVQRAIEKGAQLLPIDSEHNAIFQCLYPPAVSDTAVAQQVLPALGGVSLAGVRRILLTGSGGPLRTLTSDELKQVTPEQAIKHPNWSMGRKISVDSATLMNKGLELIEAIHLFSLPATAIDVVVHPQSVIHSMVEYVDGSVMASLASPDMRVPIAHALAWPERIESGARALDFTQLQSLSFEAPDTDRFPCLRIAREVAMSGDSLPTVLNAANEVAVDAFLNETVGFHEIAVIVERTLEQTTPRSAQTLQEVLAEDERARRVALQIVQERSTQTAFAVTGPDS